jgi:ribonuclease VapC
MPELTSPPVLDASAFLAYLRTESGADVVPDAIAGCAIIVTVNLADTLSTLASRGKDPTGVAADLTERGLLGGVIAVEPPFTTADAVEAARLRPLTRDAGLSLADRGCIAVAWRLSTAVLTADQAWSGLTIGVDAHTI